jgi:L-lactate dehydrogenase complex protein LldG
MRLIKSEEILEKILEAANDPSLREGLNRSRTLATAAVSKILAEWPDLTDLANYIREVKKKVIENINYYIDKTMRSVEEKARGHAYFARDREEALKIINDIIGEKKRIIVKAKSMVTEELKLREFLIERGHEVYETDIGEFLIQISGDKPMHIIAPAIHLTKERVVKLLNSVGIEVNESMGHAELVAKIREFLREKYIKADIGISGANSIAADTGSIFLVFNEGNISLVTTFPPVHIAIVSIEKIMPTVKDAFIQTLVQSGYAGLYPPTYIYMISGPSSTADIEYQRVYGAQGPKELHVILYDGGRINSINNAVLREQLLCIRCGRCQFHCPIWNVAGSIWGGDVYGGPLGLGWTAITEGLDKAASLSIFCLLDGICKEVCPMKIDIPNIARYLKTKYWEVIK